MYTIKLTAEQIQLLKSGDYNDVEEVIADILEQVQDIPDDAKVFIVSQDEDYCDECVYVVAETVEEATKTAVQYLHLEMYEVKFGELADEEKEFLRQGSGICYFPP